MTTHPSTQPAVRATTHASRLALRWVARLWGVASTLLLLAFAFGGREHLRLNAPEAIAFLFFPIGLIVGFAIAWWRELSGGLVTVACYIIFCVYLSAWDERWPNAYFLLFSAPGFLHVASGILSRRHRS